MWGLIVIVFASVASAAALDGSSVALAEDAQEIIHLQDTGAVHINADGATAGGLTLIGTFGAGTLAFGDFVVIA